MIVEMIDGRFFSVKCLRITRCNSCSFVNNGPKSVGEISVGLVDTAWWKSLWANLFNPETNEVGKFFGHRDVQNVNIILNWSFSCLRLQRSISKHSKVSLEFELDYSTCNTFKIIVDIYILQILFCRFNINSLSWSM